METNNTFNLDALHDAIDKVRDISGKEPIIYGTRNAINKMMNNGLEYRYEPMDLNMEYYGHIPKPDDEPIRIVHDDWNKEFLNQYMTGTWWVRTEEESNVEISENELMDLLNGSA